MADEITRRNLLRNGGAGLVAIGTAGMAGCLDDVPVIGDGSASGAPLRSWLAEPDLEALLEEDELWEGDDFELDDSEVRERGFSTITPDAIFDNEPYTSDGALRDGWAAGLREKTGVPATELEWQLSHGVVWEFESTEEAEYQADFEASVASGNFDVEDVEINLEDWADDRHPDDEDLSSEGTYEEFDLYEYDPESIAFAVRGDYVIEVTSSPNVETVICLEDVIDARFGDGRGWEEDPDAEDLLAHTPDGHLVSGNLQVDTMDGAGDWTDGLLGGISSLEVDGETSELTLAYLYERERDAHDGDLREYVDANRDIGDEFATLHDYSIVEDERVLVVTGTVRTSTYM